MYKLDENIKFNVFSEVGQCENHSTDDLMIHYFVHIYFLMNWFELMQIKYAPKAPPRRVPKAEVKTYLLNSYALSASYFLFKSSHVLCLFAVKWLKMLMLPRPWTCCNVSMQM